MRRSLALHGMLGSTLFAIALALAPGCQTEPASTGSPHTAEAPADSAHADLTSAALANAAYQDVEVAEAAGYASTMADLGCFENADSGGMGLHYLKQELMDAALNINTPEALVYELDANGEVAGLVAHEYIVPVEAWTSQDPPTVFGRELHRHATLPLWVLHAWIWRDNPAGMFEDYNPEVRPCPEGVNVFGDDAAAAAPAEEPAAPAPADSAATAPPAAEAP
jgi:hypothetical protein